MAEESNVNVNMYGSHGLHKFKNAIIIGRAPTITYPMKDIGQAEVADKSKPQIDMNPTIMNSDQAISLLQEAGTQGLPVEFLGHVRVLP